MPDATTPLAALKEAMRRFVAERDWEQFHSPKNLAMGLAVEAAELMEHFLWVDNEPSRQVAHDPAALGAVALLLLRRPFLAIGLVAGMLATLPVEAVATAGNDQRALAARGSRTISRARRVPTTSRISSRSLYPAICF